MEDNQELLLELRSEIDIIDNQIHELIMKRTEKVKDIAKAKNIKKGKKNQIAIRPDREAQILRRLKENHNGEFPIEVIIKIWREIFSAITKLQNNFDIAVFMPKRGAGYLEIARDHFGSYSKLEVKGSVGMVIKDLIEDKVGLGVVPVLEEDKNENGKPWWFKIISEKKDRPRIIAKLPFNGRGEGRGDGQEAYVLAKKTNNKTGQDRSFIVLETQEDISISTLRSYLKKSDLKISHISGIKELGGIKACLIEVDDFVDDQDKRLEKIEQQDKIIRAINIGSYAKTLKD